MKKLLLLLALSFPVHSSPVVGLVSFHLDQVPVIELAQLMYSDMSKTNYAIDSSVLSLSNRVSVHFTDLDQKQALGVLETLLKSSGVQIDKTAKIVFLRAVSETEKSETEGETFFYRPKYRSVGYIVDLCGALFQHGRFSGQRAVSVGPIQRQQGPVNVPPPAARNSPSVPRPVDNGTNAYSQISKEPDSFFFTGPVADVERLKKLLVQVDTALPQVFVKGMVYEVTTGQKEGSAFRLAVNLLQGKFGLSVGKLVAGGDSITFKNENIDAVFSALNTDSRFRSVSNPSLRVQSGGSARFSVGSDVPVLGAVQIDRNGNPIQSVEYKPSGVIFDLKPTIRENSVDLTINQQLSSFIPTTTGVNNSPTLIKREISTSVGASDDDVIVLGGLDEEKSSADTSGFSFLPAFLRSKGGEDSKTQILLVLQVQKI